MTRANGKVGALPHGADFSKPRKMLRPCRSLHFWQVKKKKKTESHRSSHTWPGHLDGVLVPDTQAIAFQVLLFSGYIGCLWSPTPLPLLPLCVCMCCFCLFCLWSWTSSHPVSSVWLQHPEGCWYFLGFFCPCSVFSREVTHSLQSHQLGSWTSLAALPRDATSPQSNLQKVPSLDILLDLLHVTWEP